MAFKHSIKFSFLIFLLIFSQISCSKKYTKLKDLDNKTQEVFKEVPLENNLTNFYNDDNFKYKIGVGDKVNLVIYNDSKDSTTAIARTRGIEVDNNGEINIPLVKTVKISGMTVDEITKKLEKLYAKYIKQPHIMFNVTKYNSSYYYLTGGISKPGKYPISLNTNLLEAMTRITPILRSSEIQIIYMKRGKKVLPISISEITKNSLDFSKIHLENGDIFFIPFPSQNRAYILGEIKRPGAYQLQSSYTLLDIISDAGGILPISGDKGAIYLVREIGTKQYLAKVDFDKLFVGKTFNIRLMPGDRILVSSTILTDYNRIIEQLLPTTQLIKDSLNIFNSVK